MALTFSLKKDDLFKPSLSGPLIFIIFRIRRKKTISHFSDLRLNLLRRRALFKLPQPSRDQVWLLSIIISVLPASFLKIQQSIFVYINIWMKINFLTGSNFIHLYLFLWILFWFQITVLFGVCSQFEVTTDKADISQLIESGLRPSIMFNSGYFQTPLKSFFSSGLTLSMLPIMFMK